MLEEFEATNEELQASNEELIAGNEELQSTNEELQSVNEELHSVNAEYNQKIRDVAAASADLRNLIATSHAGVVFTDENQAIRLYTPGAAKILNLMPQDVGRPLSHITSQLRGDDIFDDLRQVQATLRPVETTMTLPEDRFLLRRIQTYQDADGLPAGFAITYTDITERKRNELAEAHRHALIKMIIDASGSRVAVVDRAGMIVATNQAWEDSHAGSGPRDALPGVGNDYLDGKYAVAETGGDAALQLVRDVLARRRQRGDVDFMRPGTVGPEWVWVNVSALPPSEGGAVITHTDITARKRAEAVEQKLLETAKLESLGILAGGIAHDFNNLLTGILANASLVRAALEPSSPHAEPLADVERAALQATELCSQMLAFSGRGRFVVKRVQLGSLVHETTALIRASLDTATTLDLKLDAPVPEVEVDRSQIQQVVMNLVINASEALGPAGGNVRVEIDVAAPGPRDDEVEVIAPRDANGVHVVLAVEDGGCGIERESLERIFEPFHTSKFTGRGLGLSAVLGIVRGHAGGLYVRSTPGRGTTFRMLLPAVAPAATPVELDDARRPAPQTSSSLILVIDDEDIVRRVLVRILARAGHRCAAASSCAEAVELVSRSAERFALALLDLTMPGVDGVETFEKLRAVDPALRVVLMSGYAEVDATARFAGERPVGFLQKPVVASTVEAAVRAALSVPTDGSARRE